MVAIIAMIVFAILATRGGSDADESEPDATSATGDGCNTVNAEIIPLDTQISEAPGTSCFSISEELEVLIGAAPLDAATPITLSVTSVSGESFGTASSTPEADAEITATLPPGGYLIEVSPAQEPGDTPPPYLLFTETSVPEPTPDVASTVDLPAVDSCGDTVAVVESTVTASASSDDRWSCVIVSEPVFAKVGVDSHHSDSSADLRVTIFSDIGDVVATGDDVFGTDPEITADLVPGTYFIEASAWQDGTFDDAEVYYDDTGTVIRHADPAVGNIAITPAECDGAPALEVGQALTEADTTQYLCLSLDDAARLTIEAATLGEQDLVLEVLGFNDASAYRLTWADGNPYVDGLVDRDPLIDYVIPAGTWIVSVTDFWGSPGQNYDIRVSPSEVRTTQ